ncbi:MAG: hypothetical protein ACREJO_04790 [Phycisphaerales bacterium]
MPEHMNIREAISAFRGFDSAKRERIVEAFEQALPAVSFAALAARIAKTTDSPVDVIQGLTHGLGGLVPVVVDNANLRRMMTSFLTRRDNDDVGDQPDDESFSALVNRLLLCDRALGLTSKAQTVLWGHGRVFKHSDTITQIRPLFFSDIKQQVDTAAIVHELRLEYRENGIESSLCVAMDQHQLQQLLDTLMRAKQKEANVRRLSQFAFLRHESEDGA